MNYQKQMKILKYTQAEEQVFSTLLKNIFEFFL